MAEQLKYGGPNRSHTHALTYGGKGVFCAQNSYRPARVLVWTFSHGADRILSRREIRDEVPVCPQIRYSFTESMIWEW